MDSKNKIKWISATCMVMIACFSFWKMQQPDKNTWNYAVASSIVGYYNDTGNLPRSQDELLVKLGGVDFPRGYLSALREMNFKNISEADFFSGDEVIELSNNHENQKSLNDFIRNACNRVSD
jgi:hypothetical protein